MRVYLVAAVVAVGALVVGLAPSAGAHHGWSGYDASQLLTLTGSVQNASFQQPHAQVTLQSEGKLWRIVLAPPSRMERRGLLSGSIATGEEVSVEGYPHRTDPEEFRAERIRVKGQSYELR